MIPSIAKLAVVRLRVRYERVPFNGDLRAARHPRDRAEINVIGQLRERVRKGVHGPDVDVCAAGWIVSSTIEPSLSNSYPCNNPSPSASATVIVVHQSLTAGQGLAASTTDTFAVYA